MRVAVTGGKGQLGRQVCRAFAEAGWQVLDPLLDRPAHDIADLAVAGTIAAMRPDLVVHCAAMTDVDGCARDPDAALRVNALGTRNVALGARRAGAAMVAISTNEVFSGTADAPYDEWSPVDPINPYGRSKAIGEAFVRQLVPESYIVRTAWLFGPGGNNFVTKMIARAKAGPLTVVCDEIGSPTYAPDLADALVALVRTGAYGTYHLVNEGVASRLEFAEAIFALAGIRAEVTPTTLAQWSRPSRVPPYTPLRNVAGAALGIRLRPWREALAVYLAVEAA
ncbi:MAG: dTDP-4-dehydrorhamnose reductase [Chloroflexota bacterium]|nr:dTDP-4-dehydrorhamnose reductase [Dehalococcoidia bacterium]MDW8252394.1 dTDP-4-dehydrorhamnose reductase [Chloroflexota bacterium]